MGDSAFVLLTISGTWQGSLLLQVIIHTIVFQSTSEGKVWSEKVVQCLKTLDALPQDPSSLPTPVTPGSQTPARTIIYSERHKNAYNIKLFGNYSDKKDCLKVNAVRTRIPMMSEVKAVNKELQLYFSYLLCEDGYMVCVFKTPSVQCLKVNCQYSRPLCMCAMCIFKLLSFFLTCTYILLLFSRLVQSQVCSCCICGLGFLFLYVFTKQ